MNQNRLAFGFGVLATGLVAMLVAANYPGIPCMQGNACRLNSLFVDNPITNGGTPTGTTANIQLFVDPANGSDTNPCTSSGSGACLTIPGVCSKIATTQFHQVNISLAAGTYDGGCYLERNDPVGTLTSTPAIIFSGTRGALVTPTTGSNMCIAASATAGGTPVGGSPGTWGTITCTGAGWTVNNFAGNFIVIDGGTGNGQVFPIDSNTATVITIAGKWDTTPDNTSGFEIRGNPTTVIAPVLAREISADGTLGTVPTGTAQPLDAFFVRSEISTSTPQVMIQDVTVPISATNQGFLVAEGSPTMVQVRHSVITTSGAPTPPGLFDFYNGAGGWIVANVFNDTIAASHAVIRVAGSDSIRAAQQTGSFVFVKSNEFLLGGGARGIQGGGTIQSLQNQYSAGQRGLFTTAGAYWVTEGDHFTGGQTTGSITATSGYSDNENNETIVVDGDTFDGNSGAGQFAVSVAAATVDFEFDASTIANYKIAYEFLATTSNSSIIGGSPSLPTPSGSVTADIQWNPGLGSFAFSVLNAAHSIKDTLGNFMAVAVNNAVQSSSQASVLWSASGLTFSNGTVITGGYNLGRPAQITAFTGKLTVASAGTGSITITATDGTNTCTGTGTCAGALPSTGFAGTATFRIPGVAGAGTGCFLAAGASVTATFTASNCGTTTPQGSIAIEAL